MFKYLFIILISFPLFAQDNESKLLDKVIAVVGDKIILYSDVEIQYQQYLTQGNTEEEEIKCKILEQLLLQKLLLEQALEDSIEVSEDEIEGEIDRRIRYFTSLIGSEDKLEEYYGKTLIEIKDEFREDIREQLLSNRMKSSITASVKITPTEVKKFFNDIPTDSLPYFNAEMEVGQIVIYPKVSKEQKQLAKEKILSIRERIENGEKFSTMAVIYSEDPGSASNGGDLGFVKRGELVSEFEAAAFSLKEKEISKVVETQYGYHIIQLIERRGEKVNVRHILIKPQITRFEIQEAEKKLDSVRNMLINREVSFAEAVNKFSDDEITKTSGGVLTNNQTGTTFFETEQMEPTVYFSVDKLSVGEYSKPLLFTTQEGKQAYRILYLKSETAPHQASLKTDYNKIQAAALAKKQEKAINEWIVEKKNKTYIFIDAEGTPCHSLSQRFSSKQN